MTMKVHFHFPHVKRKKKTTICYRFSLEQKECWNIFIKQLIEGYYFNSFANSTKTALSILLEVFSPFRIRRIPPSYCRHGTLPSHMNKDY